MKQQISQEEYDRLSDAIVLDYVKDAIPVVWHQMAMDWNYDNDNTFFNWLIDNPATDRATALMVYWMSAPRFSKQYLDRNDVLAKESWYINDFDFLERLESKLMSNFFANTNFAYNPKEDHTGTDWTAKYLDLKTVREIPIQLFQSLEGQIVPEPTDFIEGFPQDVIDQFDVLHDKYDIIY